jgi:hypothetical protein
LNFFTPSSQSKANHSLQCIVEFAIEGFSQLPAQSCQLAYRREFLSQRAATSMDEPLVLLHNAIIQRSRARKTSYVTAEQSRSIALNLLWMPEILTIPLQHVEE